MDGSCQADPQVGDDLNFRLRQLHEQLLEQVPDVDRIACALYEPSDDMLKTFVHSTRQGLAIKGYEFRLAESASLSALAASRSVRILDEIADVVNPANPHSQWLLNEGYRSSFTVPLYERQEFIGFLLYDSLKPAAFSKKFSAALRPITAPTSLTISNELNLARSITTSAQVARECANLCNLETGNHLERMAHYSRLIAKCLAPQHGLSDEYIEHHYLFAPLHDVGKLYGECVQALKCNLREVNTIRDRFKDS